MTAPSTKGIIDMLVKGFELLAEGMANIFCGVERKSKSLLKKERTFDEFMKEVFDGDYYISLRFDKENHDYDFKICFDPSKWAEIQNFYDKDCHIDECFLITDSRNGYLMKDVFIKNINYVSHIKLFEVTFSCKSADYCEYRSELEELKSLFKDNHHLTCEEFYANKGLFKKYGFTWEYNKVDEDMILHYPKD